LNLSHFSWRETLTAFSGAKQVIQAQGSPFRFAVTQVVDHGLSTIVIISNDALYELGDGPIGG